MPRAKAIAARTPAEPPNLENAIADLTDKVGALADQIEVLRVAIDDARSEIESALRHLPRQEWVPTQPLTSMPRDPLAEDFVVNRTRREDLPADDVPTTPTIAPAESAVRRELF